MDRDHNDLVVGGPRVDRVRAICRDSSPSFQVGTLKEEPVRHDSDHERVERFAELLSESGLT